MAEENQKMDPSSTTASSAIGMTDCEIQLIYGSDKPEKGYNIPADKIEHITIKENFFLPLPMLTITLNDSGMFFHDVNFQIGNTFYLKLTPVIGDPDLVTDPVVESSYVIQAMEYYYDADRDDYLYKLHCIYSAEKYLNDICVWPKIDTLAGKTISVNKTYTSNDVLEVVMTQAGLKYVADFQTTPDDNMSWLNSTLTYQEFAKKIVSHAWIRKDDMPLLFVDRNGIAHYTSLNNLCDAAVTGNYMNATKYQKIYNTHDNTENNQEKRNAFRVYDSVSLSNYGYLQNMGGYNTKKYIFNPYNVKEMNNKSYPPVTFNVTNMQAITLNDTCFRGCKFKDTGINEKGIQRLANVSNKSATQGETCRNTSTSLHFKQTHENYDFAPGHHECMKYSFFQQFAFMTIPVSDQPGYAQNPKQTLSLGDKISIDFSTIANDTTVQSCNFIVTGLVHDFSFGSKYTIVATCVTDGIGGIGALKKETKNTQR